LYLKYKPIKKSLGYAQGIFLWVIYYCLKIVGLLSILLVSIRKKEGIEEKEFPYVPVGPEPLRPSPAPRQLPQPLAAGKGGKGGARDK
jgi:hypothetical protein